jgi:hypothetical protein
MSSAESEDGGSGKPPDLAVLRDDRTSADRDADPVGWGLLSLAYAQALHGVDVAHFAQAQQAYRDALTMLLREDHPAWRYAVSSMLAYLLAEGRPADVAAEQALWEAAAIVSELSSAADAAPGKDVHAALGLRAKALTELAEHDPASYKPACEAQSATAAAAQLVAPHIFADASLALAELLLDHDGDKSDAIAVLEQALAFYRADSYPTEWIRCHWHLGRLFADQAVSCADLMAAFAHIEDVVTVKPPLVVPVFYALACAELARLLGDERCPEDKERLDRAISLSEECLKYWPEDDLGYLSGHAVQLSQGARRSGRLASMRAMVVGDSLGDLSYVRLAAERIGQLLGVQLLIGEWATLAAVLAQLPDADLAHFACHGYLRVDQPALSAIVLADGALTAGQLQRTELRCDVLVLSGCDTRLQPVERTLDVDGPPRALIEAGARTAIGGLWAVNDRATQELFTHFYTELARAGAQRRGADEIATSVAGCLRAAELALRKTRPGRYFWASFIAVGSW